MNSKQKAQARAVILSVLQTHGSPMKATEIAADPKARRIGARSIGQLIKSMDTVQYDRGSKRWSAKEKKQVITVVKESSRVARIVSNPAFVGVAFSVSRQQTFFKVGECEFPFTIID